MPPDEDKLALAVRFEVVRVAAIAATDSYVHLRASGADTPPLFDELRQRTDAAVECLRLLLVED
jgi:hypothetical protein